MTHPLIRLYAVLVCALFGIILTSQILGFLGFFTAVIAIPMAVIATGGAYWLYARFGDNWLQTLNLQKQETTLLSVTTIVTSVVLIVIIYVQRMILWHQSSVGEIISNDFTRYHAIKIFQLVRDGSVWNLAIPYGQYPYGLEGLVAFGMLFVPDLRITGTLYAFVFIIFWLTITLMLVRFAQLSLDVSLLLAVGITFVPMLFAQLLNVGKNDVLLSTTILIAILHAPIGDERFHPFGLAFATMLSLATKATGLYVLFYVWGLVMLNWAKYARQGRWRDYLQPVVFIALLLTMFPGGLWVIRNYVILGELFTSEISSFFQTTIVANLDNPALYESYQSRNLLLYLSVAILLSIAALFKRQMGWQMFGVVLMMIITFAITPLATFLTINDLDYLDIQWRFVLHGVAMVMVIAVALFAPFIRWAYAFVNRHKVLQAVSSIGLVGLSITLIFFLGIDDLFGRNPNQWDKMLDPTLQDGSIYDELASYESGFVLLESVEWLPILIQNPQVQLSETVYPLGQSDIYPLPQADYIAFNPLYTADPVYALYQDDPTQWQIIFENPTGRIYQRVP